jgi:hypothetical protein
MPQFQRPLAIALTCVPRCCARCNKRYLHPCRMAPFLAAMDDATRASLLHSLLSAELDSRPAWVLQLVTLECKSPQLWQRPQQLATDVAAAVLASAGSSSGHLQLLEELLQTALEAVGRSSSSGGGSGSQHGQHGQEGAMVAATQALVHAEVLLTVCKVLTKHDLPTAVGGRRLRGGCKGCDVHGALHLLAAGC